MDIDPADLLLFARIVELGSFSLAAERVRVPKSTVSRRITVLEGKLGERLLQRTTRKLVLTEFGASLLEHARNVVEEVEAVGALVQFRQVAPSGKLRVSMPADIANAVMGDVLSVFMVRYPAITLELDLSPRRVDLVAENFDLAIRMGDMPDDSTLVARRVMNTALALYASPGYTSLRGLPEQPDDLQRYDLLNLPRRGAPLPLVLMRGKVRWERELPARLLANSPDLLMRLAVTGAGIAVSPAQFAKPYVDDGQLVQILPEWSMPESAGWAVFPGRRLMPAKTRAFLDTLEEIFARNGFGLT